MALSVLKDNKAGEIDINFDEDFYSLLKVKYFNNRSFNKIFSHVHIWM